MWALRRASVNLRNRGLSSGNTQIFCMMSEIVRCYLKNQNSEVIEPQGLSDESVYSARFYKTSSSLSRSRVEIRSFSSQATAESNKGQDDDLVCAVSVGEAASGDEIDDDSFSESEFREGKDVDDNMQNELEFLGTETGDGEERSSETRVTSPMSRVVLKAPSGSVGEVLDKWVEEGNKVTQSDVLSTMIDLRNRRMFFKALKMLEWLDSTKHLEFSERNYVSRVDLIAKVHGLYAAEKYIKSIPKSFQGETVYRTLLANCVASNNLKKSEEVFNKMKSLFPITQFACNQLLLLYRRTNWKRVPEVLKLMKKENIKRSAFTYQILIDLKVKQNDIGGMEQLVEMMKSEGLELTRRIKTSLARCYAVNGLKDKAEAMLKEIEGDDLTKNPWICRLLLPIYASLGSEDEVRRIWNVCEPNPQMGECMAGIVAWGRLKRIDEAEAAFNKMVKKLKKPTAEHYAMLLDVYANHKIVDKGKELIKQMVESGTPVGPFTWDVLVKFYIGAGEVERADVILEKAMKLKKGRPLFTSYISILDQYAKRGDIHNTEKMLIKIREAGYAYLTRPYQSLLLAYISAKTPAYGFKERLKADNVEVDKKLAHLLDQADAFRKSPLDELLE